MAEILHLFIDGDSNAKGYPAATKGFATLLEEHLQLRHYNGFDDLILPNGKRRYGRQREVTNAAHVGKTTSLIAADLPVQVGRVLGINPAKSPSVLLLAMLGSDALQFEAPSGLKPRNPIDVALDGLARTIDCAKKSSMRTLLLRMPTLPDTVYQERYHLDGGLVRKYDDAYAELADANDVRVIETDPILAPLVNDGINVIRGDGLHLEPEAHLRIFQNILPVILDEMEMPHYP